MDIEVVAYGIAREIVGSSTLTIDLAEKTTIRELKNELINRFPEFSRLASLKFAVNEEYEEDSYEVRPHDEVVIIPPVSGG